MGRRDMKQLLVLAVFTTLVAAVFGLAACEEEEAGPPLTPAATSVTPTAAVSPTGEATPTAEAAATPAATATDEATQAGTSEIGDVARYAPSGASNLGVQEIRSNDVLFAELSYTVASLVSSPGVGPEGGSMEYDRQYLELYSWSGQAWDRVFNLYDLVERIYTPDQIGPIVEGEPQEDTAVATAAITPVSGVAGVGDVLVLETALMLGPRGYQHPNPTITVLRCDASGCAVLWTDEFAVRGGLVSAMRTEDGLDVTVQAYLPEDPMCCPHGWEIVRLVPGDSGLLGEVKRCVGPEYNYCLSD
jgi:hypothetical protein